MSTPRAGPARPAPRGGSSKVAEPHLLESERQIDSYRLRREDDGRIALEFGALAGAAAAPADAVADPFQVAHRILLTDQAAWRMVDGLARALGRPLAVVAPPAAAPATVRSSASSTLPASQAPATAPGPARTQPPAFSRVGAQVLDLGTDAALRQRGTTPLNLPPDPMAQTAEWLSAAVAEMAPGHYVERSFRIAPGSLQANRMLLSIGSRQMPPQALERAWAIASHLGLPAALRPQVEAAFTRADHLHFGFEGEPERVICKLYFERTVTGLEAAASRQTGEPALQYEAFKWNVATGEHLRSQYLWFAGLSAPAIAQRMAALCEGADPAIGGLARTVLDAAAPRLPPERLLYLEVVEAGQPRKSFDLNLYDAQLTVRELQPVLFAMRDHFAVRAGQFQALYDQIKSKRLGHVAGGIHRNGEPFFNVYFGGARQA